MNLPVESQRKFCPGGGVPFPFSGKRVGRSCPSIMSDGMSDGKARLATMSAQRSTEIMGDLQGRITLVTGGAQGIGRAIAEELAAAGATLALADVNETTPAGTEAER